MDLRIVHYPHPTLRHKSRPLSKVDRPLRQMIEQMFQLMYEHQGVGLAANQVDLPYRLFVTNVEGDPAIKEAEQVFINPVLSGGKGQEEGSEGCLSIPGVSAPIVRSKSIKVQAYDLEGQPIDTEVEGLMARVLQHETDHLDGQLFIDRLGPTQQAAIRDELEQFEIEFTQRREEGAIPSDEAIAARLQQLEAERT